MRQRGGSYSAYWREDGKVKELSLGSNLRLAKIELADIEKRILAKKNGAEKEMAWDDFVNQYLGCCQVDMAKTTVIRVRVVFSNLKKTMPIQTIRDLTPEALEEYKQRRKNFGTQASTINRELTTLKSAMKKAGEWGYASPNIWGVRKLPTVKKRPVFYTTEELNAILKWADPLWQTVIHLGVYLGLRRGEILNLEWNHIDFEHDVVRIRANEDWHPKNREEREVPMRSTLKKHLLNWKSVSLNGAAKIIPWNYSVISFSQAFTRIVKKAGVNKGSLHTLRHTFASHLASAGVDLLRVGRMMGHSSVVTTQIYAHLMPSSLKEAVTYLPEIGIPLPGPTPISEKTTPHSNPSVLQSLTC
ncbi:MAG: Tyrosine recombinase XerC [Elusimicrobia bacterium]|nr:Tyrosine recombinase XerC [Elusimicrobiota bacterium]